ncbi:hypothetical protein X733_33605 [Mesorhizobium sp. L2C067A000]|nr:hypothetical protein X733_33605 [Mesorhizobium sp. L2C067A000]
MVERRGGISDRERPQFYNFTLSVMAMAIFDIDDIARRTRASMIEVMTQQYIRTARLRVCRSPGE